MPRMPGTCMKSNVRWKPMEQPEVDSGRALCCTFSRSPREPIVEGAKNCKENAADDHIMKVSDEVIRVSELPIERRHAKRDSRKSGNHELKQKGNTKQHRRLEAELASPYGRQPVEDLDSSGNSDGHCREYKEDVCVRTHPDRKHVVGPYAHADKSDGNGRCHHRGVAENRFA